jgi:hypothetical protein
VDLAGRQNVKMAFRDKFSLSKQHQQLVTQMRIIREHDALARSASLEALERSRTLLSVPIVRVSGIGKPPRIDPRSSGEEVACDASAHSVAIPEPSRR